MSTTVTTKGRVTIPKNVRDYLGLRPGTIVEFESSADGRVFLVNKGAKRKNPKRAPSRFSALRGAATVKMSTRQIMALTRGAD